MRRALPTLALLLSLAASASAQVGTIDTSFGTGGLLVDSFQGYDDLFSLEVLPSGEIVIAGRSSSALTIPSSQSARLFRYGATGDLLGQWSYNNGVFGCSVPEAFYDLVVEPGGTVLAGGFAQFGCGGAGRDFWIHRIQPDGSSQIFARPSFYGVFENAWGLALHPDGRVTAGGIASPDVTNLTRDLAFTRFTPDGEIDLTFGTAGETTVDVYGDYDFLYDLLAMPDGGVLAVGFAYDGSQYDLLLVRLTPDGVPDAGFGTDGITTFDFHGGDDYAFDIARQPDGQLVVVGRQEDAAGVVRPVVLRLAPNGSLDPTFGTNGIAIVDFGGSGAFANGLVLQADGKIVVSGGVGEVGARDVAIARLLPDGTPDPSFGTGGMQTASWSEVDDLARDLAIAPDGDLVVLGVTQEVVGDDRIQDLALARFVGDTAPVSTEETPAAPLALSVAPNPASGAVRVRYSLDAPEAVRLSVFDALGREVAVLARGPQAAGEHETVLDTAALPAGIYMVRLEASGGVRTQTVTVVR